MTSATAKTDSLSPRELDCLIAIESLSQKGWPARTSDIARTLRVKPPSAVELNLRLQSKRLLVKGPGGVRVSRIGLLTLREIHRSHRILEVMFANLGLAPDVACRESKKIDRYVSKEVTRAFCNYLGHPSSCPDQMPIAPDPQCCKIDARES